MMTSPLIWLTQFLGRRDLQQPDGRKLYGYRLTQKEYEDLRSHLRLWLGDDALDGGGHLAHGTTELFVLYGAAWWEREYAGGAWKWDEVISSFGGDPDAWPSQFRSQCVRVGLQFWKQRLGTAGKKFFGVLVEQGGLPRFLLARSKGNIYTLIRTLLRRAARLDAQCDEIAAMVPSYEDKLLPRSLRNTEVHQLIAQVVNTVLDLKKMFRLSSGDNAVARMDKLEPLWRERFPIALDDEAALVLLSDLVGEAASLETETRASPVLAERLLCRDGESYTLVSRLDLPKSIDVDALARLGGFKDNLPNRLTFDLDLGTRYFVAVARKAAASSASTYALTVGASSWGGDAALREHMLYIGSPEHLGTGTSVPGGMEMDADSPWVFVEAGDESRLIAQGSVRLRQEQAQLVVATDWSVASTSGQVERLGQFECGQVRREVYVVSGDVTITTNSHTFHIRTRHMGIEADRLVWEGRRLAFPTSPSLAFLGTPTLYRYMPDGGRVQVPLHELEWRLAGTSRVIPRDRARGPVDVLWRVDGELRLRNRIVIFDQPPRLLPGESLSHGRVELPAAWSVDRVSCDDPTLHVTSERCTNTLLVDLTASEEPPESVKLTLDWTASPVLCRMLLPFPASGGRFFGPYGQRLAEGESIALDQLLGVRLQVFDANPNRNLNYRLVFSLHCEGPERPATTVAPVQRPVLVQDCRAEIRLIDHQHDIESLMCLTALLDAVVKVTLRAGNEVAASLEIRRYEFSLQPEGASVALRSQDFTRLAPAHLAQLQLHAVRLEALDSTGSIVLAQQFSEGVPTGRWCMPADASPTLWLVYPNADAARSFRALLLDLRCEVSPLPTDYTPAPESIQEVLLIDEPHRRRDILARRLNALAVDFRHADWALLEGAWTHLGHLALPSLDLWRALSKNVDALAAFACREWVSHSPDDVLVMCGRLHTELGVMWETVPLQAWYDAAGRLLKHWNTLMPQPELQSTVASLVADRLRAIRISIPSLNVALALVTFQVTGLDAQDIVRLSRTPPKQLLAALWLGEHSTIQNFLLRNFSEREPLKLRLCEEAVLALNQALPGAVFAKVLPLLWDLANPKAELANMPVLLALCSCNRWLRHWWVDPKRAIELRQYLDFERDWFRHAYDQTVAICVASGLYSLTDKKS
jgi:hypothetical protein